MKFESKPDMDGTCANCGHHYTVHGYGDACPMSMKENTMTSPEALTNERKSTHGDWNQRSKVAQSFKDIINKNRGMGMTDSQREALDMIAVKMSRILCGNPNEPDHWDDIAGYAYLGKGGHKAEG